MLSLNQQTGNRTSKLGNLNHDICVELSLNENFLRETNFYFIGIDVVLFHFINGK